MCRTVHSILSTVICGIQMLVRVFMTIILMLENLIRMILQTLYNFISFMLQLLSLIPICVIFLVTTRLKCFMCGGGGPCPVNRGGACDCLMSAAALILLFFIFRAVGLIDKIFYKLGYVQAPPAAALRFMPTPGDVTECSREVPNITALTAPEFGDYEVSTTTSTLVDETTNTETLQIDLPTTVVTTSLVELTNLVSTVKDLPTTLASTIQTSDKTTASENILTTLQTTQVTISPDETVNIETETFQMEPTTLTTNAHRRSFGSEKATNSASKIRSRSSEYFKSTKAIQAVKATRTKNHTSIKAGKKHTKNFMDILTNLNHNYTTVLYYVV